MKGEFPLKEVYDEETLQKINENVNLLDYVGQSIELKRHGKDYFGHCPRHVDNTPSFSINPEKNLFHCFSCGKSGGIISYLINYEGMSFDDAVKKGASLSDFDLTQICHSETISFLKKVCNQSKDMKQKKEVFHKEIQNSELYKYSTEPAREWVEEGISEDVMKIFGVRIDSDKNRIVYPVYDIRGNLINIKGRTRYSNYKLLKIPKYINYFPVGVMDYFQGLNITYPYIKNENEVIIFESIKSVMKMYGWGYKNCVSAETHILTKEQLELLIGLKVDIVIAYDTDVDCWSNEVMRNINKLRMITNVFIIDDVDHLLGGVETKNSPADCGIEIWEKLYKKKKKIV